MTHDDVQQHWGEICARCGRASKELERLLQHSQPIAIAEQRIALMELDDAPEDVKDMLRDADVADDAERLAYRMAALVCGSVGKSDG